MNSPPTLTLEESLARLDRTDQIQAELWKRMFEAYGGAFYGMDLLAAGALNRSKAHIAGFRHLIESKNLICAGALLRLQLDTALRFHAAFLVEHPHDFAIAVLEGRSVRKMNDRDGQRMTDAYLVKKLGKEFEWIPNVYEKTSGYIHLSSVHLMSAMGPTDGAPDSERAITIKFSAIDRPLPAALYIEAVEAFRAATEVLLNYVDGWVFTKANPDLVQKWKQARDGKPSGA